MSNQTPLRNFSLEGDQVALPKGASAQSHRLNVRWRGKDLDSPQPGRLSRLPLPRLYARRLRPDQRIATRSSAPQFAVDWGGPRELLSAVRRRCA